MATPAAQPPPTQQQQHPQVESLLALALEEADRAAARQRSAAAACDAALAAALASPSPPPAACLVRDLAAPTKALHGAVAKLSRAVDRAADAGAGGAAAAAGGVWRALPGGDGWRPPRAALDTAVAAHLYREGRAELADAFCAEAGVAGHEAIRAPYAALHGVLQQMRRGNLGAALEWARHNRRALLAAEGSGSVSGERTTATATTTTTTTTRAGNGGGGDGAADNGKKENDALPASSLELWLHSLGFVLALVGDERQVAEREASAAARRQQRRQQRQQAGQSANANENENDENEDDNDNDAEAAADARRRQAAALSYARRHLAPFRGTHLRAIQRLMACLLWAARPARGSPYPSLLAPVCWPACAGQLASRAARALGASSEPPLAVAVAAGGAALPALIKLSAVLERSGQDMRACGGVLPVEIELGDEFAFCSVFACPVSREPSSAGNPPVLLPCGHVLCEQSVARIAKSRSRAFKCPYCPMEARLDQVTPIVFP